VGDGDWAVQLTLTSGSNAQEVLLADRAGNHGESEWVDLSIAIGSRVNFLYNTSGRLKQANSQ
jgi:hypothetical protein